MNFTDEAKLQNRNIMAGLSWFNIIVANNNLRGHNTYKNIVQSNNILMNTAKSTGIGAQIGLKWHLIKDK